MKAVQVRRHQQQFQRHRDQDEPMNAGEASRKRSAVMKQVVQVASRQRASAFGLIACLVRWSREQDRGLLKFTLSVAVPAHLFLSTWEGTGTHSLPLLDELGGLAQIPHLIALTIRHTARQAVGGPGRGLQGLSQGTVPSLTWPSALACSFVITNRHCH